MSGDVTRARPTEAALVEFANGEAAIPLSGGMDTAWRAGDVVLKPSPGTQEARLLAESHAGLAETEGCRFQRPVQSGQSHESWEIDGWVAWQWIEGETAPERTREIVLAARAYHSLLKSFPFDHVLTVRKDPWGRADRVAWGEAQPDYSAEYLAMLAPLLEYSPPPLPSQRIHADLTGNVVFAPGQAPGIIDPTLYWRPAAFAEAVVLVDQSWFVSTPDLSPFFDTPHHDRRSSNSAVTAIQPGIATVIATRSGRWWLARRSQRTLRAPPPLRAKAPPQPLPAGGEGLNNGTDFASLPASSRGGIEGGVRWPCWVDSVL